MSIQNVQDNYVDASLMADVISRFRMYGFQMRSIDLSNEWCDAVLRSVLDVATSQEYAVDVDDDTLTEEQIEALAEAWADVEGELDRLADDPEMVGIDGYEWFLTTHLYTIIVKCWS